MNKVVKIYWERCNLHLEFSSILKGNSIFMISDNQKINLVDCIQENELIINVTNTPEGNMLDKGNWKILIDDDLVIVDKKILKDLDDKSRVFKYKGNFYAYIVDFSVNEDMSLSINTNFMMENRKYKKYIRIVESKSIKGKIKTIIRMFGYNCLNILYKFFHLILKQDLILFFTENGEDISGNLKYLYESFESDKIKVKKICFNEFKGKNKNFDFIIEIYNLAKSKVVIVDNYTPILTVINLSKETKLIQLWHAGVGFKSVGYARFGKKGSPHPYHSCHRKYTEVIVDKENLVDVYKEVFGVKKEIIKSYGMPRLDNYLEQETISKALKRLYEINPKFENKMVILFSPTYRGNGSKDAYYDFENLDLDKINSFCRKNNFIFIIKMHPFVKNIPSIKKEYSDTIYNYSNMDINELIYVTDIMITDYSSCAYEYSMFDRPLIFYRYDKEIYEYFRPVHTADSFTKEQYEVITFEELLNKLEELKNISINDRFKNIKNRNKIKSCGIIKKEIL